MKKPIYRIVRKAGKYNRYIVQKCYFGLFWRTVIGNEAMHWNYKECQSFIEHEINKKNLENQKAYVVNTYYEES